MKYIEVTIVKTSKPYSNKEPSGEGYQTWDRDNKLFGSVKEALNYLKGEYGNCKKQTIYKDTDKGVKAIGWVYSFRNKYDRCYESHWIDLESVTKTFIDLEV